MQDSKVKISNIVTKKAQIHSCIIPVWKTKVIRKRKQHLHTSASLHFNKATIKYYNIKTIKLFLTYICFPYLEK